MLCRNRDCSQNRHRHNHTTYYSDDDTPGLLAVGNLAVMKLKPRMIRRKPRTYLFWTWCRQKWRQRRVCSRWMIVSFQDLWHHSPCSDLNFFQFALYSIHKLMDDFWHKTLLCCKEKLYAALKWQYQTCWYWITGLYDYMKLILHQIASLY